MIWIIFWLLVLTGLVIFILARTLTEVKKGNKDQQEIKTRLDWLKKGVNALQDKFKVRG